VHDGDVVSGDVLHHTALRGDDQVTGVVRSALLDTGTDVRSLGAQQWHSLTLHVRTHEGTVCVVVLQERNHRGCDGDHLARGDVHVIHLACRDDLHVAAAQTDLNLVLGELHVRIERRIRLGDDVTVLFIRGEVLDVVGDRAIYDATVRRLDETERVHAGVRRQGTDQTNVRTLGGLNRAQAAVVRRVNVADLAAGALTGQTTRTQRGQTALVGQAGQGVVLVHELGQLRGTEELADRCRDRTHVDQGGRGDGLGVLRGHALADDALHAGQANPDLILDQHADRTQAAVTEVVDVVDLDRDLHALRGGHGALASVQADEVLDRGEDVFLGQGHRAVGVATEAERAVDLVAADLRQVVALRAEEGVLHQGVRGVVGPQQDGHRLAAPTVDADTDGVALSDLAHQPCTAGPEELHAVKRALGGGVDRLVEVHARGANQLGDDDTLGAVDQEGALVGH